MAECLDRQEYHLTPSGWIAGGNHQWNWWADKEERKEVPPPADRVETWTRVEFDASTPGDPAFIEWECVWASPDVPEAERAALRARYPEHGPDSEVTPDW
jgi:hypothetical protein